MQEVDAPGRGPGEVVVDVERAGVCGTDVEFFTGEMAYLHDGHARYPMRLGHEWSGDVAAVGDGVDPAWLGRRVTGDTMLGCGACHRCRPAAPARLRVPVRDRHPRRLPGCARRAAGRARRARCTPCPTRSTPRSARWSSPAATPCARCGRRRSRPGDRVLVLGTGTIGLLVALFARAAGAEVHLLGRSARSLDFAADARLRRRVDRPATLPGAALRRRDRRVQRAGPARAGARPRRAGQARRLRRARRRARA